MKTWIVLLGLLGGLLETSPTFAATNIFAQQVHDCVKAEIRKQHSLFSDFEFDHVATVATDETNFEYIIWIKQNGRIIDRVFISVKDGDYSNAVLTLIGLSPQKLNLSGCF